MLQSMGSQRFTHNLAAEKVPPGNPYLPNIHLINLNMFLLYGIGAMLLGVFTNLKMYF